MADKIADEGPGSKARDLPAAHDPLKLKRQVNYSLDREEVMVQSGAGSQMDRLLEELQQGVTGAEQQLQQRPPQEREQIACGPGCSSCCVVNVAALWPEGVAISRYLQRFSKPAQQLVAERLESLWQRVRGLDDGERLVLQSPCAFLDKQGRCLVYPVRPLLCRSVTSTDLHACQQALSLTLFDAEKPVLMYRYQQQLYERLFIAFADRLEERGMDGRSVQLSGLVRYLLNNSSAAAELLSGERLDWQALY